MILFSSICIFFSLVYIMENSTNIIVIGAGVTGLTTALVLKQKGYKHVTIVAKCIPSDMSIEYTSPYAGLFLPFRQ
jgi:thioredoxin reductase